MKGLPGRKRRDAARAGSTFTSMRPRAADGAEPAATARTFAAGRKRLWCLSMTEIVLRVRLVGGDHLDVTYGKDGATVDELIEHAISVLAEEGGSLRCQHGDRLMVLYGRGIATLEVAPRGAIV